jgi:hypothetical protein
MRLLLLGTAGCHLCEDALLLINRCRYKAEFTIEQIDIAEQTEWQDDFATKIPVLLEPETHKSLDWPFTQEDILTFIKPNT